MRRRYFLSKLLNVFFTRALNAHLSQTAPVIINTVNPKLCATDLASDFKFPMTIIAWLMKTFLAYTAEEGSRQLIYAAVGGGADEHQLRGAFISNSEIKEASDFVIDEDGVKLQERLWVSKIGLFHVIILKLTFAGPYRTRRFGSYRKSLHEFKMLSKSIFRIALTNKPIITSISSSCPCLLCSIFIDETTPFEA